jgi:hypothetical protein
MRIATGESEKAGLRLSFDRRLKLEFHGARVTADAGLLAFRELDDARGLTAMAAEALTDARTGMNSRHSLVAQFRQSVFSRLAGYEDVNDADRLGRDPAMRWAVGGPGVRLPPAHAERAEGPRSRSRVARSPPQPVPLPTGTLASCPPVTDWPRRNECRRASVLADTCRHGGHL